MRKLKKLLKATGVDFITGNYKSYFGFILMQKNPGTGTVVKLSIENKYIGEYDVSTEETFENKIQCSLCDKSGKVIVFKEGYYTFSIVITLNPFRLTPPNDQIGTFLMVKKWGNSTIK